MNQIKFVNKDPYIIAEIGANHNGDFNLAKKLIEEAEKCGADCIKFQIKMYPSEITTYEHANRLTTGKVKLENVNNWEIKELGLKNIFEAMDKFHFSKKQYEELIKYANELGIEASASVFSKEGVDFLRKQDIAFIKIASMDFTNTELIDYVYSTGIPMIAATGMCSESEIELFFNNMPKEYFDKTALLHCVSLYPPELSELQLNFISTLKERYKVAVGFSDHTIGTLYPLISFILGGSILEKHFTIDNTLPGWDHKVSADPKELKYICENAKNIKKSLGDGTKKLSNRELDKREKFRRSLTTKRKMKKGEKIKREDIEFKRPGTGIPVNEINKVLGKMIKHDIDKDKTLHWNDLIC
jgi:N-acetylneuraminate synthase